MAEQITTFSARLKEAMSLRKKKQADLIRLTGLSKQQLSQYVNGKCVPRLTALHLMSETLDVNEIWLMGYDVHMRRAESENKEEAAERIYRKITFYQRQASSENGEWLAEGYEYELVRLPNIPPLADFALRVRGDSMEPMYSNDEIVFVKTEVVVESGQIGLFCLNGVGYLKMLQGNKLVSVNNKYKPIVIDEYDRFFYAGRVIGKF